MMDRWKEYEGKKVFIETRSNRQYSGRVINVDVTTNPALAWITIIDKFGQKITFVHSEIIMIQEEVEK